MILLLGRDEYVMYTRPLNMFTRTPMEGLHKDIADNHVFIGNYWGYPTPDNTALNMIANDGVTSERSFYAKWYALTAIITELKWWWKIGRSLLIANSLWQFHFGNFTSPLWQSSALDQMTHGLTCKFILSPIFIIFYTCALNVHWGILREPNGFLIFYLLV